MSQVQYLPWATAGGANVMAPALYAARPEVLTGVVPGTASSIVYNTAARQASVIASAIAQFIAQTTNADMLDDGNVQGVVTKLKSALATILVTSVPPLYAGSDVSSVANSIVATVAPALTGPVNGGIYVIRNNNTNTGPTQMALNGGQTYPCVKGQGAPLSGAELFAGDWTAWTFNGSSYQLLNDKTVTQSFTINVSNVQQLQQAIVSTSLLNIASNAYVTIQLAAGTYNLTSITGALRFAHTSGLQINLVGAPLKGAVPTYTQLNGLSNAQAYALLQSVYATNITSVGCNALEVRGLLGSVQNILFSGDQTASGGYYGVLASNWSTSLPATATLQMKNCAVHGFGLDNIRAESGGFIQVNNVQSTYSSAHTYHISHNSCIEVNVGNCLGMYGTQGVALQNQGLFAVDSASGTCDFSLNSVAGINSLGMATINMNPATAVRIQGNKQAGITSAFMANIALPSNGGTTFSGNGQDIAVYNIANVLTFGCALPSGSTPGRGSSGNNGCQVY